MSYLPLRDTFDLDDDATRTAIHGLIDVMDVESQAGVHHDQCACPNYPARCPVGKATSADTEFALGWLLREGWITVEQIRTRLEAADADRR